MVEALSSGGDEIMSAVAALPTNHKSNDNEDEDGASKNNTNHIGASAPNPSPTNNATNTTSIQQRAIEDDVSFVSGLQYHGREMLPPSSSSSTVKKKVASYHAPSSSSSLQQQSVRSPLEEDDGNTMNAKYIATSKNGSSSNKPQGLIDQQSTASTRSSLEAQYYTSQPKRSSLYLQNHSLLSISQQLRELRHNTCLMTPLTFIILLAIILTFIIGLLFTFPQLLLGLLLGPLIKRNYWLVEFLYRYNIARWGHLTIMSLADRSKTQQQQSGAANATANATGGSSSSNGKKGRKKQSNTTTTATSSQLTGHSSTIHQRITVVPNRVYIHPIPQFMDNIAYLIVCTPPPPPLSSSSSNEDCDDEDDDEDDDMANKNKSLPPIIGILIDCGESTKIIQYMEYIYSYYYHSEYNYTNTTTSMGRIELYAVLCTHRHHDGIYIIMVGADEVEDMNDATDDSSHMHGDDWSDCM